MGLGGAPPVPLIIKLGPPWAATPPAGLPLLHFIFETSLGGRLPYPSCFAGKNTDASCAGAQALQEHTTAWCWLDRVPLPLSGHGTGHLHCSLPAPSPVPLHNNLHNAWGAPGPRPHSWGVADLAWPTEPWILPALGWDPKALQKEIADVRGGLAQLLSCTPTLPLPEPSALILASGCTASSYGTLGHGPCPHLSPTLTRSRMALQTCEGLPLRGKPGTQWPLSGQALPGLRPARPRWSPHSGDSPLPPPSSLWPLWQQPLLAGSPPAPWALPPYPLSPSREGRVPFLVLRHFCPPTLAWWPPVCTGPLLGIGQLPCSLWPCHQNWGLRSPTGKPVRPPPHPTLW